VIVEPRGPRSLSPGQGWQLFAWHSIETQLDPPLLGPSIPSAQLSPTACTEWFCPDPQSVKLSIVSPLRQQRGPAIPDAGPVVRV
jgi:hypothetical protein